MGILRPERCSDLARIPLQSQDLKPGLPTLAQQMRSETEESNTGSGSGVNGESADTPLAPP